MLTENEIRAISSMTEQMILEEVRSGKLDPNDEKAFAAAVRVTVRKAEGAYKLTQRVWKYIIGARQ